MADQLILDSPFGMLALTPNQVREASARASEVLIAVGSGSRSGKGRDQDETWLTPKEMAERTGTTVSYWMDAHRASSVPSRKFGKAVRFPASFLLATESGSVADSIAATVTSITGGGKGRNG